MREISPLLKNRAERAMEWSLYIYILLMFGGHLGSLREAGFYISSGIWFAGFALTMRPGFNWKDPLYLLLSGLCLSGLLSALANYPLPEALLSFKRTYLKVFLLASASIYVFSSEERQKRGILILGIGGILYLLYAIYQTGSDLVSQGTINYGEDRYFATVLLFFLPFGLLLAYQRTGLQRKLWYLVSMAMTVGIISVGVRGGWIALAFVLAFWVILVVKSPSGVGRSVAILISSTLVILILIGFLFPKHFKTMKAHTLQKVQLSLRFEAWSGYLALSRKNIFTGHGISEDRMRDDYRRHYESVNGTPPGPYIPDTPHNQYIKILYQQGLPGLGLYIAIILGLMLRIIKRRLNEGPPTREGRLLFYGASLAFLGEYLIRCFLEDRSLLPFALLLGIIMGTDQQGSRYTTPVDEEGR
jgi:O-antigen ligase